MRQKPAAMMEMQKKMKEELSKKMKRKELIAETKKGLKKVIKKYGNPRSTSQKVGFISGGVPYEFAVRKVKSKDGNKLKWVRIYNRERKPTKCADNKKKNAQGRCVLKERKKRTYKKKVVDRSIPCKEGEYRRKSGHCAKRPTYTKKRTYKTMSGPCPRGKIKSTKTGRCIKGRKLSESARAKKALETRLAREQMEIYSDRPLRVGDKAKTVVNGKTIEFVGRKVKNKKTGKSPLRWVRVEKGKKRTNKSSSKKSVKSVPAQPMFGVNPKAVQKGPNAFSAGVGAVPVFGRPMNSQKILKNTQQVLDNRMAKYMIK